MQKRISTSSTKFGETEALRWTFNAASLQKTFLSMNARVEALSAQLAMGLFRSLIEPRGYGHFVSMTGAAPWQPLTSTMATRRRPFDSLAQKR
jgi:hypothetical protein